jgi:hypothetical protein
MYAGYAFVGPPIDASESLAGIDPGHYSEFNFLNSNLFAIGPTSVYSMREI